MGSTSFTAKVAVVISSLSFGGAERQVVELANHVDRRKIDLRIFILSDHAPLAEYLVDRNARLHIIPKRTKFDFSVVPRLGWKLNQLRIEIVHGILYDAEIASRLAGRLAGCSIIIGSERNTRNNNGPIKRAIYRYTSRFVDICIANCRSAAAFNRSVTGLPESAYRIVYNGVDVKRFRPRESESLRRQLGLDKNTCIVGMFSSFKRQKNHFLLLQAARLVLQRCPNVMFVFIGDTVHEGYKGSDGYKKRVIQLVNELNLQEHCLFLGEKSDVERYYNMCDITVLPSLFEGTPNTALESMASGVPVIATDVSDNRYVIPDGKVGYIVPLNEPEILASRIQDLALNQTLRQKLGSQARVWVEREFSSEKMAKNMEQVYLKALAEKRNRTPRR